jgi:hypothetical protein
MNIANLLSLDAVVMLRGVTETDAGFSLYVRAGEKTTVTDVLDGEYEVRYIVGERWTGGNFARPLGTYRLGQPLTFEDSFVVVRHASGTTVLRVPGDPWNIVLRGTEAKANDRATAPPPPSRSSGSGSASRSAPATPRR